MILLSYVALSSSGRLHNSGQQVSPADNVGRYGPRLAL